MSEDYTDIEEARLQLATESGRHEGIKYAEKILRERSGELFMANKDYEADLLRKQAGTLHQEAELVNVKRANCFDKLEELEGAPNEPEQSK